MLRKPRKGQKETNHIRTRFPFAFVIALISVLSGMQIFSTFAYNQKESIDQACRSECEMTEVIRPTPVSGEDYDAFHSNFTFKTVFLKTHVRTPLDPT